MVKMTFTLDDETVAKLRQSAARLEKAQSEVVREAIAEYAERVGRLSERERQHLLGVFDWLVPVVLPAKPTAKWDDRPRPGWTSAAEHACRAAAPPGAAGPDAHLEVTSALHRTPSPVPRRSRAVAPVRHAIAGR